MLPAASQRRYRRIDAIRYQLIAANYKNQKTTAVDKLTGAEHHCYFALSGGSKLQSDFFRTFAVRYS